jgi:hypothetical protein
MIVAASGVTANTPAAAAAAKVICGSRGFDARRPAGEARDLPSFCGLFLPPRGLWSERSTRAT